MNISVSTDPFQVLGVSRDASEEAIRARYLELVKQFPPERDPDKFREVQAAFQAAKDPLLIARRLLAPPSEEAPRWSDAIEAQRRNPPALTLTLLLSLGNRRETSSAEQVRAEQPVQMPQAKPAGDDPHQKQYFVEQPHE